MLSEDEADNKDKHDIPNSNQAPPLTKFTKVKPNLLPVTLALRKPGQAVCPLELENSFDSDLSAGKLSKEQSIGSQEQFEKYTCEIYDGLKVYASKETDSSNSVEIHPYKVTTKTGKPQSKLLGNTNMFMNLQTKYTTNIITDQFGDEEIFKVSDLEESHDQSNFFGSELFQVPK